MKDKKRIEDELDYFFKNASGDHLDNGVYIFFSFLNAYQHELSVNKDFDLAANMLGSIKELLTKTRKVIGEIWGYGKNYEPYNKLEKMFDNVFLTSTENFVEKKVK